MSIFGAIAGLSLVRLVSRVAVRRFES
jgi:hypothetical protein